MATISSLGIGANIDAESIITQLMSLERQPITKAQDQITKLNTKLSTWGKIQSSFSTLKDAASALAKDSLWDTTAAKISDAEAMSVTTGTSTSPGSYSVQVNKLAQAQFLSTAAYTSKTDVVGDGTLVIEMGAYADNPSAPPAKTFTAKADATAVSIEIGAEDNTLEKIRDKINAASAGVTASIVNDASGARLVIKGQTGENNAFKVSVTEGGTPGLSALAYDPSADINADRLMQAATNAQATINGIVVSSATNNLDNVVDGLSIKLSKVTTAPVDVTISRDTDTIQKALSTFTTAYSDVISQIRVQTLYDEASKTGGPLQGDSTATGLLRQLRSLAASGTSASSVFDRLSSIGISMKTDGTFSTDSTKLGKALENMAEVKKLFATDSDDPTAQGVAIRFRKLSEQITGSDGSISTRTDGIKGTIKRSQASIDQLERRATAAEDRLRKQYAALDQSSSKLSGLSNYVTQQLAAMNN